MTRRETVQKLIARGKKTDIPGHTTIDTALRRMNPAQPGAAAVVAYQQLAAAGVDLARVGEQPLRNWVAVLHVLALARWRYDPKVSVGEALVAMNFGDNRLKQLLSSDAAVLLNLLPRIARRFASHTSLSGMDLLPLVELIFAASGAPETLDAARLNIARSYTRAQLAARS